MAVIRSTRAERGAVARIMAPRSSAKCHVFQLELRHVGKLNTRVLWFFMKNRRIVLLHGVRNKGQAIPSRDLATARERMHDWQKRATE